MTSLDKLVDCITDDNAVSGNYSTIWEGYLSGLAKCMGVDRGHLLLQFHLGGEEFPVLSNKYYSTSDGRRVDRMPRSKLNNYIVSQLQGDIGTLTTSIGVPRPLVPCELTQIKMAFHLDRRTLYQSFAYCRSMLIDAGSDLPNLEGLREFYRNLEQQAREEGAQKHGVLFISDLALLHEINKMVGFDTGDDVIKQAATQLHEFALERWDKPWYLSRLKHGGDEFGWIYVGADGPEVGELIRSFKERLAKHPVTGRLLKNQKKLVEVPVAMSIGWMPFRTGERTFDSLMSACELYINENHKSRDCIELYNRYPQFLPFARNAVRAMVESNTGKTV